MELRGRNGCRSVARNPAFRSSVRWCVSDPQWSKIDLVPRSEERPQIARTGDAIPPFRSSMEDGVGNIDSRHEVFALSDQARELFKTLPTTDDSRRLAGQGFGRFHL